MIELDDKQKPPRMTPKQLRILKALHVKNDDGSRLDIYQLIDRCAPGTTRGSMMSSLQHMAAHDLIAESDKVVRAGKRKRTYVCTEKGARHITPQRLRGS